MVIICGNFAAIILSKSRKNYLKVEMMSLKKKHRKPFYLLGFPMFSRRVPEGTRTLDIQNHKQKRGVWRNALYHGVCYGFWLCYLRQ
jgi:hypothetical protein